jgi:transposase
MVKKYVVSLSEAERHSLEQIVTTGKRSASTINHARILLKADSQQPSGGWRDQDIKDALDISIRTIERVRQRFVEVGLDAALKPRPGQGRKPKLDGEAEAHLVALRCSEPPTGQGRWTLRLLAKQMVALDYIDQLSHESVRQALKKTTCNPGGKPAG